MYNDQKAKPNLNRMKTQKMGAIAGIGAATIKIIIPAAPLFLHCGRPDGSKAAGMDCNGTWPWARAPKEEM